jgi:hypothetical protein
MEEEIQVHSVSTSMELTKEMTYNYLLKEEFDHLIFEQVEATQKKNRIK